VTESDDSQQADYRSDQAELKAAKARAKALRPWYKKKRYILGAPLAALFILGAIGSATSTEEEGDPAETAAVSSGSQTQASTSGTAPEAPSETTAVKPAPTEEPTQTPEAPPGIGDLIEVGSLDLAILSVEQYDSAQHNMFNEANVRVQFTATNSRGGDNSEYNISAFYFSLVDDNGVAHDPDFCASCPDEFVDVDLIRGGTYTGYLYFEVPSGASLVELLYAPFLSGNKARISLQ